MAEPRPAGPAPTAATLREAALAHLARFATTRAGLLRVLHRRIDRWARAAGEAAEVGVPAARAAAAEVVSKLAASGAVDDAAFAEARARSLGRAGRSRRATLAHLQAKGVAPALAQEAVPQDGEAELAAALAHARRRRLGPFANGVEDADLPAAEATERRRRALAAMARAGFSQETAQRALRMDLETAEAIVIRLKQG